MKKNECASRSAEGCFTQGRRNYQVKIVFYLTGIMSGLTLMGLLSTGAFVSGCSGGGNEKVETVVETSCNDGMDNDNQNGADCDDSACATDLSCVAVLSIDVDGDGIISTYDEDDNDPNNVNIKPEYDTDQDGQIDSFCMYYDSDDNGTLSASEYATASVFCDNCIGTNNDQTDTDADGLGDVCDPVPSGNDADGDLVDDAIDNCTCPSGTADCSLYYNFDQIDTDGDGLGDTCDDSDGDLVDSSVDNCLLVSNADQTDTDGDCSLATFDGTQACGDACDTDADGDGSISISYEGGDDCDDTNSSAYPGNTTTEDIGGTDTNCDGTIGDAGKAVFAYLSDFSSPTDHDGTFNKSYPTLQDAIDDAEDKYDNGVTDITVILYTKDGSVIPESVTVDKPIRIAGGYYCADADGNKINLAVNGDICTSINQVKRYSVEDAENGWNLELNESYLSTLEGDGSDHTMTITGDATIEQMEIIAPTTSRGYAAVTIQDSSPTVKNCKIEAPQNIGYTGDDNDGNGEPDFYYTRAVSIVGQSTTTSPTLRGNVIIAGERDQAISLDSSLSSTLLPYFLVGIRVRGEEGFVGTLKPVIQNNKIEVGNAYYEGVGIYVTRADAAESSSASSLIQASTFTIKTNDIYVDFSEDSRGIYFINSGGQVERNKIIVSSSSYASYATGVGQYSSDETLSIYTNLILISLETSPYKVYGIWLTNGKADLYANTVVVGEGTSETYGFRALASGDTVQVRIVSNIFDAYGFSGTGSAIYSRAYSGGTVNIKENSNNLADKAFYYLWYDDDHGAETFIATSETTWVGGIIDYPDLDSDFIPTADSPAIDTGYKFRSATKVTLSSGSFSFGSGTESATLSGPTTDLDGVSRGDSPDIGCYEYNAE